MTDNQKKLSRHEMSMTEGVRAEDDTIRDRTQNSSEDLTAGTPPGKSTEEGLNQEFNSLEAQREGAEAYLASQQATGMDSRARALR